MLIGRLRGFSALILLAALTGASAAGDFADRHVFGFSPDGRYFAFEEYGVQDGSGAPYSNIYMIEVAKNRWLPGPPVRVLIESESPSEDIALPQARAKALEKARDRLDRYRIGKQPNHVASNPISQLNADFNFVLVDPRFGLPPIGPAYAFKLSAYALPRSDDCPEFEIKGFELELIYGSEDSRLTLQRDERIPESRFCPLDYQIADIYTFFPDGGRDGEAPVFAVLIRMLRVGFEGPDGRYLAVTGKLPD